MAELRSRILDWSEAFQSYEDDFKNSCPGSRKVRLCSLWGRNDVPDAGRACSILRQDLQRTENRMFTKQTLSHSVPTTPEMCADQPTGWQWRGSSRPCLSNKRSVWGDCATGWRNLIKSRSGCKLCGLEQTVKCVSCKFTSPFWGCLSII